MSDNQQILSTVVWFRRIGDTRGRLCSHPERLDAAAGYDSNATRELLKVMGIKPFIRRRNTSHGSRLGGSAGWSSGPSAG